MLTNPSGNKSGNAPLSRYLLFSNSFTGGVEECAAAAFIVLEEFADGAELVAVGLTDDIGTAAVLSAYICSRIR